MSVMDNEGHDPQGFLNTPQYRGIPKCKLCNDTGEQRYWEGRWRDEKAENERLLRCIASIEDELTREPPRVGDALFVCEAARVGADHQQRLGEK